MILVTGVEGFIGGNLYNYLKNNGYEVMGLDRGADSPTFPSCLPDFIENKFEWIFHMGAISETNASDWDALLQQNVNSTKAWIEYANEIGCGITYASSASVYGDNADFPNEITTKCEPKTLYGKSKLMVDEWVLSNVTNFKVPIQGLRFFNVYGKGEQNKKQPSPIHKFIKDAIEKNEITVYIDTHINFGEQTSGWRDFISVDDCVYVMIKLMECKYGGIYNCGSGRHLSFLQVANIIANKSKTPVKVRLVEMPDEMKRGYQYLTVSDNTLLKYAILDFNPMTVEEWVQNNWKE